MFICVYIIKEKVLFYLKLNLKKYIVLYKIIQTECNIFYVIIIIIKIKIINYYKIRIVIYQIKLIIYIHILFTNLSNINGINTVLTLDSSTHKLYLLHIITYEDKLKHRYIIKKIKIIIMVFTICYFQIL